MSRMLDPYLAAVHGLQALRRRADRDGGALLGALGVAVDPLPHQIASVRRIIEAPEIRHLIADGVGLGKTVQALMIINALRLGNPAHRTLLIAPDHLLKQWYEEFSIRGHLSASLDLDLNDAGEQVDLARPVRLVKPSTWVEDKDLRDSAFDNFDLLVIDEPQLLPLRVRQSLTSADRFSQFLALSATPGFGDAVMRDWLLTMLEPERAALAKQNGQSLESGIKADEQGAIAEIMAGGEMGALWRRDALGRRICRWSREEWPTVTPRRVQSQSRVAPFLREAQLAELATRTMRAALDGDADNKAVNAAQKAQNLHRVGRSAREAGGTDILNAPDAPGISLHGDSRFDALLDHLTAVWNRDPKSRVLIVAGDNDTIQRLERRLPAYFEDSETGEPIALRAFSRLSRNEENEASAMQSAHETLDAFVSGPEKVLLIGEWAQAGLNLHHSARELVFYSCPWSPDSIDQLIGRLDRIGKDAERMVTEARTPHSLGIHVITWDRSPEARVVDGLEALGVFRQPIPPGSEETKRTIRRCLNDLAANRNIRQSLADLSALGSDAAFEAALSDLAMANPYSVEGAWHLYRGIADGAVLPGALSDGSGASGGARAVEEANIGGWLTALTQTRVLDIWFGVKDKLDDNVRYSTAWYSDTGARYAEGGRPLIIPSFERRHQGDHRSSAATGKIAFMSKRKDLPQPPRIEVGSKAGGTYPLTFFDHGDPVHENLCAEFIKQGDALLGGALNSMLIEYPPDHAALEVSGSVLLTITCQAAELPTVDPAMLDDAVAGIRADQGADRVSALRSFHAGLDADDRWMRLRAPGSLDIVGSRWSEQQEIWADLSMEEVVAYLDPRSADRGAKKGAVQRNKKPDWSLAMRRALPNRISQHQSHIRTRFVGQHATDADARSDLLKCDHIRLSQMRDGEARAKRAQVNYDKKVEGEAARIDRLADAEAALHSLRLDRLNQMKRVPMKTVNMWTMLIVPIARNV